MVLAVNEYGDVAPIVKEYFTIGDVELTASDVRDLDWDDFICIKELGVSIFHHEVIKRVATFAMETPSSQPLTFKLLEETSEGLRSSS